MRLMVSLTILCACRSNNISTPEKVVDDEVVIQDADGDGYFEDEDCDDQNAQVNQGAEEICDGIDNNCDGQVDEEVQTLYYEDGDEDGFGNPEQSVLACSVPEGYVPSSNDCDDSNANVFIGNNEECDGLDNNCDGEIDEGVGDIFYADIDADGYGDANNFQLFCELPAGFVQNDQDCDDTNDTVYPDAPELCDGLDNNCDLVSDDGVTLTLYLDEDGDGFGTDSTAIESCTVLENYVSQGGDCDDINSLIFPGASEVCDGEDNDCDGDVDSTAVDQIQFYVDSDGDGFGDLSQLITSCSQPSNAVTDSTDCDDQNAAIHPNAIEECDGIDNNCNGFSDDQDSTIQNQPTWYLDADSDGYGNDTVTMVSCVAPTQYIAQSGDCNDLVADISPSGVEECDGVDNNCDGQTDEGVLITYYIDSDGDGYGMLGTTQEGCSAPTGYVDNSGDCNDSVPEAYTNASETCDGLDNNCDGQVDEGVLNTWYLDLDGDGYGDSNLSLESCTSPSSVYVADGGDCNENEPLDYPGAPLGCDDIDHDCDGLIDNDADGDGYSAYACGGSDCDDSDVQIFPNTDGVCPLGTDCLDLLQQGYTASGVYTIDPDGHNTGVDAEDVWCEQTQYGGGWTRIATNHPSNSLWNATNIRDVLGFGTLNNAEDYKSAVGFASILFTDIMFTDEIQYAVYGGVGDGTTTYFEFSASVPVYNCAPQSGYEWPMTQGNLGGGRLCTTNLYMHPIDRDGYSNCNPNAQWANNGIGPTWSLYNNGGCPLDDPSGSTFIAGTPNNALPWSDTGPLYMYVR